MGGVASRCSDVNQAQKSGTQGSLKPLDASSSEDEGEGEEEEEDDEDEEEDDGEADEEREAVEDALSTALKRGKTGCFKEIIDHATAVGIAEDKIAKAEAALEHHKAQRKREAFESELRAFLGSGEADDLDACEEREKQGLKFGVGDKVLQPLREHAAQLRLHLGLSEDEVAQAHLYLEVYCRRFVRGAVKGRSSVLVDRDTGKKSHVKLFLDLTLRNLTLAKGAGGEDVIAACKVEQASARRAAAVEEIASSAAFSGLDEALQEHAVAVLGPEAGPWLLLEEGRVLADEVLIGLTLVGGSNIGGGGGGGAAAAAPKGKTGDKAGSNKKAEAPSNDDPVTEGNDAPLPPPSEEEEEPPAKPPTASKPSRESGAAAAETNDAEEGDVAEKDKKEKKDKKDKKEKKDKKSKREE